MKDVSKSFEKAILLSKEYDVRILENKIEQLQNIWCFLDYDSNYDWYVVGKNNGDSLIEDYAYLSTKFPIVLVRKNCPKNVYNLFLENNIVIEEFCENYCCDENILKHYVTHIALINDNFMYDENIEFNMETFYKIDEGINYINPYNFSFWDIYW